MKKIFFAFCLSISFLISNFAFAYIPEYSTLLSKAAAQHGKGIYQIEQEVTFQKDSESYAIKETWLVQNESSMRVTFEGRGLLKGAVQGVHVYDSSSRHYVDSSGAVRQQRLTEDWLNPFLVFRSSKYPRQRLVNMKVAPQESLNDRAPLAATGTPNYTPPNFLRLARVGGSICYAIGTAPASQGSVVPTAWLEQDQFVFRKLRTSNNTVWKADDFTKTEDGFWYPKSQSYSWGTYNVTIQTISVKPVAKTAAVEGLLRAKSLQAAKDTQRLPDTDALKEFFSRFR